MQAMKVPILVALTATLIAGQHYDRLPRLPFPGSPCPQVFNYSHPQPDQNSWTGTIFVSVKAPVHGLRMRIVFTEKGNTLSSEIGEVWTLDNKDFTILDLQLDLKPEKPLSVFIKVTYGDLDPVPLLASVELHGQPICPPPIQDPKQAIDGELDDFPSGRQPINSGNPRKPEKKPEATMNLYNPKECGQIRITTGKGLIRNSQVAPYGQFPWHAALSEYDPKSRAFSYVCGGTLISPSVVLTAAHCVVPFNSWLNKPISNDALLITLGKYSARAISEDGVQERRVVGIHVYPSYIYNNTDMRHDIAIIQMSTPATINNLVRPICMWEKDKVDLDNVINKYGTVVGWGLEVDNRLTEDLRKAKMPIVRQDTCILSDALFYSHYTSEYTYCAGSGPGGSTVCNGDSGGGMIFKKHENRPDNETPWLIRGVVSTAKTVDIINNRCDGRSYVVFTDVAKYLGWIQPFIEDNK